MTREPKTTEAHRERAYLYYTLNREKVLQRMAEKRLAAKKAARLAARKGTR